jgi:putative tricarboxylic transport membrane protein
LQISQGNWLALFHSWIAIVLWVLAIAAVVVPLWLRARGKTRVLEQIAADTD